MSKFLFLSFLFGISCLYSINAQNYRDSVDVTNYDIHIDLSTLASLQIYGYTNLKISSCNEELKSIGLDLLELNVDSVLVKNKAATFLYNGEILRVPLVKPIKKSDTISVRVYYHGYPKHDKVWGGFFMSKTYAFNYGVGMGAIPPNYGRVWFPCIDNFTDRAFYDFFIKVKKNDAAACPGILLSVKTNSNQTKTYHWKLHQTIPTYLASVAVSDYVLYQDSVQGLENNIPISIYVNKSDEQKIKKTFVHLKDFLHAFENAYGPYVWDKIGYVATPFKGGAMEHATNIAYGADCNGSLKCENTLAHELSHHWFGDLVTCRTEKDMWLNEGWASYSEAIFIEYLYGRQAYKDYRRNNHKAALQFAHLYDNGYRALYGIPHEYTYGSTVYKKGADVAGTLRYYLGDRLFFSSLKRYFKDYAFSDISTDEFRDYLSRITKIDLDGFFDFWVYNPGFPHFSVEKYDYLKKGKKFVANFKIIQQLLEAKNYLCTPLEVGFVDKDWTIHKYIVPFAGKSEIKNVSLNFEPLLFMIDPDEKIADATTDEYCILKKEGKINFNDEFFSLDINSLSDSVFFRIVHNWISPKYNNLVPGKLQLTKRYWEVQFVNIGSFNAQGIFKMDISAALDKNFINYLPRQLGLYYRKNALSNWIPTNAKLEGSGRKISFILSELKQGEYVVGQVY